MSESTAIVTTDGEVIEAATLEQAPASGLFGTSDPVEVVKRATAVADALADVLVKRQLFERIQGKAHVKVEGWQLLGSMLGVTAVCVATEEVDGGWKATVEARTADGRVVGRADALCTKHERRGPWKTADEYARLSMAQTRATSKALKGPLGFVVSLAGYATTPAEEMTFAEPDREPPAAQEPPRAAPAARALPKRLLDELVAAKKAAALPDDAEVHEWVRAQLVAIGVESVPPGRVTLKTLRALTAEQAGELLDVFRQVAEARRETS